MINWFHLKIRTCGWCYVFCDNIRYRIFWSKSRYNEHLKMASISQLICYEYCNWNIGHLQNRCLSKVSRPDFWYIDFRLRLTKLIEEWYTNVRFNGPFDLFIRTSFFLLLHSMSANEASCPASISCTYRTEKSSKHMPSMFWALCTYLYGMKLY